MEWYKQFIFFLLLFFVLCFYLVGQIGPDDYERKLLNTLSLLVLFIGFLVINNTNSYILLGSIGLISVFLTSLII